MKWTQVTHTGLVRPNNEDAFLIEPALGLFAVADGMGGHRAGEVASHQAMDRLQLYFRQPDLGDPGESLVAAMEAVNTSILAAAEANRAWQGMGTTLTACLVRGSDLWVGHIGDSRAYLLRGTEIEQLTEDHTWVLELVKNGQLTNEEARCHPRRNMLVRALGTAATAQVDLRHTGLMGGDRVLLCTDGLSNQVTSTEISAILAGAPDMEAGVGQLLGRALEQGGLDNITIVLLEAE
ncbi:MAG TPA: Stp1/IreP family PP2C-type Ser/Thr phosphatase [Spirochaetia bacterium]|nr:Stp1/IreP family PP2C-type Ser/Thr phosphatase [Spirochaetia bacterium]